MKKVIAVVEREKCFPDRCKHECMKYDPINRSGGIGFHLGEHGKSEIAEELVSEIHRISAKMCPFQAIHIVKLPEKLTQSPVHSYGRNQFELFNLPLLKKGVLGIIGRNGIGKSTALNILATVLKPNLGNYQKEATEEEIKKEFHNSVLHEYFTKLYTNEMHVSYKPQRVEGLAKQYPDKTVKELITKVADETTRKELNTELELENIQDRTLDQLSGGELQRVAIAAALAKHAHVYYFDEPSSYLDILHRIKVARLINAKGKDATVIVVDHDLATLDYVSDEIQIMYGEQACYGIFSNIKAVGRGINEYLDGYLPDDNIRFRNYAITFDKSQQEELSPQTVYEYPRLKKKFTQFSLEVAPGSVHKGEVLAIMGANGLGKTTFVNMLAGLLQPDEGAVAKVSCAFKPQYLQAKSEETVEEFLKSKAGEEYNSGWYKTNMLEKLNIQAILQNKLSFLSGGELQKVYIAAALSTQADLVIMDEPSAFVDVEDRLHVAGIIREFIQKKEKTAIIVDHDIQFVDLLADSLLVFEGVPGVKGTVQSPKRKNEGMNHVLQMLGVTYRRDKQSRCARINKHNSQLDKQQKQSGKYYMQ